LKTALASNSLGAQICPYCRSRVRAKRHPHDLPKKPCLTFDKVAENSKTVQESNENVQKYSDEDSTTVAEERKNTFALYFMHGKKRVQYVHSGEPLQDMPGASEVLALCPCLSGTRKQITFTFVLLLLLHH
jgi:hypothetical protein